MSLSLCIRGPYQLPAYLHAECERLTLHTRCCLQAPWLLLAQRWNQGACRRSRSSVVSANYQRTWHGNYMQLYIISLYIMCIYIYTVIGIVVWTSRHSWNPSWPCCSTVFFPLDTKLPGFIRCEQHRPPGSIWLLQSELQCSGANAIALDWWIDHHTSICLASRINKNKPPQCHL